MPSIFDQNKIEKQAYVCVLQLIKHTKNSKEYRIQMSVDKVLSIDKNNDPNYKA